MRRALGRLLGIFLTLVLASVLALGALSELQQPPPGSDPARALPLYFNARPRNVHDLSQAAIARIAAGGDTSPAEAELARLGGAALPHVLPKLDALKPSVRGKVALALAPVARRMGVGSEGELASEQAAIAFWARFWQDRAFDFRPQVVRRFVTRLAERASTLRREDIVHLDTYALGELVAALDRIRTPDDVGRAHRLTLVLSHVTGRKAVVDPSMSVQQARRVAQGYRRFYREQGADFTTLDGPRRVTAMFAETAYGKWLARLFAVVRVGREPGPTLGITDSAAGASAARYLAALAGAVFGALGWVVLELGTRLRALLRLLAVPFAAVPAVFFAAFTDGDGYGVTAVLLAALAGAAVLSRAALTASAEIDGAPRSRVAIGAVLRALPAALSSILTALFGLELCFGLEGAPRAALDGLGQGDVTAAMALALGAAAIAALLTILADAPFGPAANVHAAALPALVEVREPSRRLRALALFAALLLGVFGAGWGQAETGALGWSEVASGARALLGYGLLTLVTAAAVGLAVGASSASGPRVFDAALTRATELHAALPTALWAGALSHALGTGVAFALCLGALRGIDVAWLVRSSVLFRARADQELGVRSLGRFPLEAYVRERLRPALGPAASALALTPAWCVAAAASARLASISAAAGRRGWDAVLADPGAHPLGAAAAALLLALASAVLLEFVTSTPRRLGSARPSIPPESMPPDSLPPEQNAG